MRFSQTAYKNYFAKANDEAGDQAFFKNCCRFSPHLPQENASQEKSAVYVHLRNKKCKKKDALMYCRLPHCKVDCTGARVGPSSFRSLKLVTDPIKIYKGWQIAGDIKHDFEGEMYASHNDILSSNESNEAFRNVFDQQVQNSHSDYVNKMKILREFYDELDQKYNYSKLDQDQLKIKLHQLEEEKILRDNIPKFYLKGHGNKYFEVAELIGKDKEQNIQCNIIRDMEAFKAVIPKAEQGNYELKQKFIDKAFFSDQYERKVKMDLERRNHILKQLKKTYQGDVKLDPQNDENYEAYQAYKEDYNKSKYFMDTQQTRVHTENYQYANSKLLRQKRQIQDGASFTKSQILLSQSPSPAKQFDHSQVSPQLLPYLNKIKAIQVKDPTQKTTKMQQIRASILMIQTRQTIEPENAITNQIQKQNKLKLQRENSFIEFERKLDEMAQNQQRKVTEHLMRPKYDSEVKFDRLNQKRLSLFKSKLKLKLGQTDLLKTNRSLMNLKANYDSERQRFFSKIDPDNLGPDPYELKQRQSDYSDQVKERLTVDIINQKKKQLAHPNTPIVHKQVDNLGSSVKLMMNNIVKNYSKNGQPVEQSKIRQILLNRQIMKNDEQIMIIPTPPLARTSKGILYD